MPRFRGSTQEKLSSEIFRFGERKAVNDKMVPDRAGSGDLCNTRVFVRPTSSASSLGIR
jgi:hypothetical protein